MVTTNMMQENMAFRSVTHKIYFMLFKRDLMRNMDCGSNISEMFSVYYKHGSTYKIPSKVQYLDSL